ncbi:MAG TPA: ABC transporter permease, partial [Blastocatellia bacterium]|nr:ABC transporter permease [Blastocatellia bacterium]
MGGLFQDLRYAIRTLGKSRGFTAVAVISLALGIGANSSIFSVINATLWSELPYREPERLVMVERASPDPKFPISLWSYPKYEMLRDQNQVFESVAAFSNQDFPITGSDNPERVEVEAVSASYFPLLGVAASQGRVFTPEEDLKPGAHAVALISQELYRRRFNSDPNVVGQSIDLNKVAFTIVGVMPEGFAGQSGKSQVWVPMMMMPSLTFPRRLASAGAHWHKVIARLAPGVTREQAQAEVAVIGSNIQEAISKKFSPEPETLGVVGLKQSKTDQGIARSFLILFAAVGFVLLIACVNIANLLMARSATRQKEMAIRMAVGASRPRLIRQLLTESVLLSTLGGALGLLVALWGIESLSAIKPASILSLQEIDFDHARIDVSVLGFNLALSVLTGLLFGLMPAFQAARAEVGELLKDGAVSRREARGWVRRLSPRNLLVVAEIALAMVLLIGAGLMMRSFARLQAIETGFDPSNTLTVKAELPKYKRDQAAAFYEQLLARVEALPGVESASVASSTPLSNNSGGTLLTIEGRPPLDSPGVGLHSVGH